MDFHVATVAQLSAHLRALRKARGLTQADLGRLLGVKQSRIADIESNPGSISVSQMHKLLSALGAQMVLRDSGGGWQPARREATAPGVPLGASSTLLPGAAVVARPTPKGSRDVPAKAWGESPGKVASATNPTRLRATKKPGGSW